MAAFLISPGPPKLLHGKAFKFVDTGIAESIFHVLFVANLGKLLRVLVRVPEPGSGRE